MTTVLPGLPSRVDLDALVRTSLWTAEQLGRPSPTVNALVPTSDPEN